MNQTTDRVADTQNVSPADTVLGATPDAITNPLVRARWTIANGPATALTVQAPAAGGRTTITDPEALIRTEPLPRSNTGVSRVFMGTWMIGSITTSTASTPGFYAWSAAFGPSGTHATAEAAITRLTARWLNTGPGPTTLLTATGTVHASRTTALPVPDQRAPRCMTDQRTQTLHLMLRTGRPVTCRHCPTR